MSQTIQKVDISPSLVLLMSIACGLCTGSNYYSQPLFSSIAVDFNIALPTVAYLSFISQSMYTLGLLFLVPLGDMFEKKKTIVVFMLLAAFGQLICAWAFNIQMMFIGTAISSLFSIAAQILIPFATMIVQPKNMAKIVGILMSGLLMGILMARTVAGLISSLMNWQMTYYMSGALLGIVAILILIKLPNAKSGIFTYPSMFKSMKFLWTAHPILRKRATLGSMCFFTVSMVFTTMALILSAQPFNFNDFEIGLVGLVGIAGILLGPWVGKQFQRGKEPILTRTALVLLMLSWALLAFAKLSIIIYVLGLLIIYIALTVLHILNQNVVYSLDAAARSRLNSIYMTIYFLGAALGSLSAAWIWSGYGWIGCVALGLLISCATFMLNEYWKLPSAIENSA